MRAGLVVLCVALAAAVMATAVAAARPADPGMTLVESYRPPADDPSGDTVRGRGWTYDSAITAAARLARGDLDGAGALLDRMQALQRPDGALESSYGLATGDGDGPLRAGNQAWVGLAALGWRAATCSGRHDRLIAGVAGWLLGMRIEEPGSPGFGLVRGGPDVSWASTEHNLEARAFFAALAAVLDGRAPDPTARPCPPGLDGLDPAATEETARSAHAAVARLDRAIAAALFVRDEPGRAHFRQGLDDDARPVDVQALGVLWLLAHDRRADAEAVVAYADEAMAVHGRRVARPGAEGQTFSGYRPFADAWGPDVLWIEGTLQMRLAKHRLGADTGPLDDTVARWVALTAPEPPLQADRASGGDYHAWPAAAAAAWLELSRGGFSLLG